MIDVDIDSSYVEDLSEEEYFEQIGDEECDDGGYEL